MDDGAQTVANILKFYNPSVVGGSLGHHIGEVSHKMVPLELHHVNISHCYDNCRTIKLSNKDYYCYKLSRHRCMVAELAANYFWW